MRSIEPKAVEALRVRQLARRLFWAPPDDTDGQLSDDVAALTPDVVSVFLAVEGCATRLRNVLARHGLLGVAAPDVVSVLSRFATVESVRLTRARAQLAELARIGEDRGWKIIVLKGGLVAAEQEPALAMEDIDILVPPRDARALMDVLTGKGYRPVGSRSMIHLAPLVSAGALSIDLHITTEAGGAPLPGETWERARRIEAMPHLWRLHPPDHLRHVLLHTAIDHPGRRPRLRDALLIAGAVRQCASDDLAEAKREIDHHPHAAVVRAVLRQAEAMGTGQDPPDIFPGVSLGRYHLAATKPSKWVPRRFHVVYVKWLDAVLSCPADRQRIWRTAFERPIDPSGIPAIAMIERLSPRIGAAFDVAGRLVGRAATRLAVIPLAVAVRRQTAKLGFQIRSDTR